MDFLDKEVKKRLDSLGVKTIEEGMAKLEAMEKKKLRANHTLS